MQEQPKRWKRGDIGPDGLLFWHYQSGGRERWMTRGEFDFNQLKERERSRVKVKSELAKENAKKLAQTKERREANAARLREWKKNNPNLLKLQRERKKQRDKKRRADDSAALMFFQLSDAAVKIEAALEGYSAPEIKEKNPEFKPDGAKWKAGEIGPNGMVFIYYRPKGAYWSTHENYKRRRDRGRVKSREWKSRNPEKAKNQARRSVKAWLDRNPDKAKQASARYEKNRKRSTEYNRRKNERRKNKRKQTDEKTRNDNE